jgi:hypothetical protein
MKDTRNVLILVVLTLVFAFFSWPRLETFLKSRDASQRALREAARRSDLIDLQMASLVREPASYSPQRNIFRFEQKRLPPPPPPPPRPANTGPPPPPPPPPPARPKPPNFGMSLIGIFGPEAKRLAVFKEGTDLIINAQEQEVLQDKFIVDKIDLKSVSIKYVGFPDEPPKRVTLDG